MLVLLTCLKNQSNDKISIKNIQGWCSRVRLGDGGWNILGDHSVSVIWGDLDFRGDLDSSTPSCSNVQILSQTIFEIQNTK